MRNRMRMSLAAMLVLALGIGPASAAAPTMQAPALLMEPAPEADAPQAGLLLDDTAAGGFVPSVETDKPGFALDTAQSLPENAPLVSTNIADAASNASVSSVALPEAFVAPSVARGESFSLAVPVAYLLDGVVWGDTYADAENAAYLAAYDAVQGPSRYHQALGERVHAMLVAPRASGVFRTVGGEAAVIADGVNHGYAVLAGLSAAQDAPVGVHSLHVTVRWLDVGANSWRSQDIAIPVEVINPVQGTLLAEDAAADALAAHDVLAEAQPVENTSESLLLPNPEDLLLLGDGDPAAGSTVEQQTMQAETVAEGILLAQPNTTVEAPLPAPDSASILLPEPVIQSADAPDAPTPADAVMLTAAAGETVEIQIPFVYMLDGETRYTNRDANGAWLPAHLESYDPAATGKFAYLAVRIAALDGVSGAADGVVVDGGVNHGYARIALPIESSAVTGEYTLAGTAVYALSGEADALREAPFTIALTVSGEQGPDHANAALRDEASHQTAAETVDEAELLHLTAQADAKGQFTVEIPTPALKTEAPTEQDAQVPVAASSVDEPFAEAGQGLLMESAAPNAKAGAYTASIEAPAFEWIDTVRAVEVDTEVALAQTVTFTGRVPDEALWSIPQPLRVSFETQAGVRVLEGTLTVQPVQTEAETTSALDVTVHPVALAASAGDAVRLSVPLSIRWTGEALPTDASVTVALATEQDAGLPLVAIAPEQATGTVDVLETVAASAAQTADETAPPLLLTESTRYAAATDIPLPTAVLNGLRLTDEAEPGEYALNLVLTTHIDGETTMQPVRLAMTLLADADAISSASLITSIDVGNGDVQIADDGTIAIAARFEDQIAAGVSFATNQAPGGETVPYAPGLASTDFIDLSASLDAVSIAVPDSVTGDASYPLDFSAMTLNGDIVAAGVNGGYATLSGVTVRAGSPDGPITLPLEITWQTVGDDPNTGVSGVSPAETATVALSLSIWNGTLSTDVTLPAGTLRAEDFSVFAQELTGGALAPITLAIPLDYAVSTAYGEILYHTNGAAEEPETPVAHYIGATPELFDQAFLAPTQLEYVSISLQMAVMEGIFTSMASTEAAVIENGVNNGYAVFENVELASMVGDGFLYPLMLEITWRMTGDTEDRQTVLNVFLTFETGNVWEETGIPIGEGSIVVLNYDQYYHAITDAQWTRIFIGYNDGTDAMPEQYQQLNALAAEAGTPGRFINAQPGDAYGVINYPASGYTGIRVPAGKMLLEINGIDPLNASRAGYPQRINESTRLASSSNATVYVTGSGFSGMQAALRNLIIDGQNYWGPIHADSNVDGFSIVYENINYNGPQFGHFRGDDVRVELAGTVRIQITDKASTGQEAFEAEHIVVTGDVEIAKDNRGTGVFWMHGASGNNHLQIVQGARLKVDTAYYFIYRDGGDPIIDIDGELIVTAPQNGGAFSYTTHTMGEVNIGPNGRLWINHLTESLSGAYPSLRTRKLTVAPGGEVYIFRTASSSGGAIMLVDNGAGVDNLVLDNPGRFVLYNQNGPLIDSQNARNQFAIQTDSINLWSGGLGLAALRDDATGLYSYPMDYSRSPTFIWNAPNALGSRGAVQATGRISTANASTDLQVSGLGPDAIGNQPLPLGTDVSTLAMTQSNFRFSASGMLSIGSIQGYLNRLTPASTRVTGEVGASGQIGLWEYPGNMNEEETAFIPTTAAPRQAKDDGESVSGAFETAFSQAILPSETAVYMRYYTDYLNAYDYTYIPGRLSYYQNPPETISFPRATMDGAAQDVLRDAASADMGFAISDTRSPQVGEGATLRDNGWQLMLHASTPLTQQNPAAGEEAYQFDQAQGGLYYRSTAPAYEWITEMDATQIPWEAQGGQIEVANSLTLEERTIYPISWADFDGVYVHVPPYAGAPGTFTADLVWTLQEAP